MFLMEDHLNYVQMEDDFNLVPGFVDMQPYFDPIRGNMEDDLILCKPTKWNMEDDLTFLKW